MSEDGYRTLIKEMPQNERPRERLQYHGAMALSNAELIAIALRTGSSRENALSLANRLLSVCNGLAGLARASVHDLCEVPGIGLAKAAQVLAAIELGRRLNLAGEAGRSRITCPADAARIFQAQLVNDYQEQLQVLLLDTKHHVLRPALVYIGSVNAAVVRVGEVFRDAIRDSATAIIIAHNHPSGDLTASPEDLRVTEEVAQAGVLLDIRVLDHLIISRHEFVSLKETWKGFPAS
jgi:DNA repair protein RadC